MRITPKDYIPLAPRFGLPSSSPAAHVPSAATARSYFLRRRTLYAVLLGSALLTLFLLLKVSLHDFDSAELDADLLLDAADLLPSAALSALALPSHMAYLPFRAPRQTSFNSSVSLRPVRDLAEGCWEEYFGVGDAGACGDGTKPKVDMLWTWVNGSDPLLQEAKKAAQASFRSNDPFRPAASGTQARLYRDHDELRHSLRSVLANFRAHAGRFFLVTADFEIPATQPNLSLSLAAGWRLGQMPQWLDGDTGWMPDAGWVDGDIGLEVVHHAQIFRPYVGKSFNSLAIESQLGHVDGISDYFVYMNDDLYMATPMTPASFYTPAYGVVLHLQSDLMVQPARPNAKTQGEWRSLDEADYLLSLRFGSRARPYIAHEAKTVSLPILSEALAIWPESFAHAATHPFRETAGPGSPADINTLFLHAHLLVERAREALLWSWVVARVGAPDDAWRDAEARTAWAELGGTRDMPAGDLREIGVRAGARRTLELERVVLALAQSGVPEGLGKTTYAFSSFDGYPYATLGTRGQRTFPALTPDVPEERLPACRISYERCFAGHNRASDVFKHIAFADIQCGDCMITALTRASGPLGLSAFLPPPDRTLASLAGKLPALPFPFLGAAPSDTNQDIPHLPLVDKWEDGRFALRDVMGAAGERNVRKWTLALLQRYRYVVANTPSLFERLQSPRQTASVLAKIDRATDAALLCINDDVISGDAEVATTFRAWQERRWGVPAAWERA